MTCSEKNEKKKTIKYGPTKIKRFHEVDSNVHTFQGSTFHKRIP